MLKRVFALLFVGILHYTSYSQKIDIKGNVQDTLSRASVKNAVVALLTPIDSALVKFTRTDAKGDFKIKGVDTGKFIIMIMHPVFADFVDDIFLKDAETSLPGISMTPKSKLLEAVILKSGSPIRIKGDTTIYTADSFNVSANANVEELLKKLPGIQVDKSGKITAMGQTVEKVLVDGEEFFGDDPGMAVKNLRADAVKEVQVFDKKSDQAEFTGIDDGQTRKTINLKLKEDKKMGHFGKIGLSGGLQDSIEHRYNNNLMFSAFKGKRKIAAFLLQGNTGQDGLSWQDNEKFGGESDNFSMSMDDDGMTMYSWRGGGSDDEPFINTQNGFIKNLNAGMQYSNKWDDKKTLSFSPKYNSQIYNNNSFTYTQSQVEGTVLNDKVLSDNYVNRNNIKTSATYDLKMDTSNTLKLTLRANFYNTESEELRNSTLTGQLDSLKNRTSSRISSISDKQSFSSNLIFKHKFKKARRTLSLTGDLNLLETDGNYVNTSSNEFFSNGFLSNLVELDNLRDNTKSSNKLTARAVYTEPLSKKFSLEVGHEFSYITGTNKQQTYSFSTASGKYDDMVDSLTNDFRQRITINKPSAKINFADKKIKYNLGAGFGITNFNLDDLSRNKEYVRNFINFFPTATFTYTYKANSSLRLNYNGNTSQPTINQLQPLIDNTNFINQYIGNPDLKPSFSNSLGLSHNSYDFLKDRWMYQSLNFRMTSNSITTNRIIDTVLGKTISQPINTDGNISLSFWSGVGFKVKKINTRFNLSPELRYSKFADVINGRKSFSQTTNAGVSFQVNKSKDKKYDFSVNNSINYNINKNSQRNQKTSFISTNANLDGTVYFRKIWSLHSDFQYYYRQKATDFDQSITNKLWNAKLQRTFKKNEFTAYLIVRDILNENIGIDRTVSGNAVVEERNDRLKRYWLLGFTWDFKNKGTK